MSNFWEKLDKPIMALAPMANVTDAAFRRIVAKYGKPDILWTEFVSADGLCSEGRERILPDLWYSGDERPIVAQIFGANPENFKKAAELLLELGFDGIDINMGCPEKNICKSGAGAALVNTPRLAQKIIKATKEGAGNQIPVSVKIRTGYSKSRLDEWLLELMEADPAAITVHLRTRKEMSKVPAHWDEFAESVSKLPGVRPLILGNGDIQNLEQAKDKVKMTGADGVMIGRGIFGNPWLFSGKSDLAVEEKLKVMLEHTDLFWELYGPKNNEERSVKNFDIMKKHYKAYVSGFEGARELRAKLMACHNPDEVRAIITKYYPRVV